LGAPDLVDFSLKELLYVLVGEALLTEHGQGEFALDIHLLLNLLEHLGVKLQLARVLTHLGENQLFQQVLCGVKL
jgi:hypothetical protein